MRFGLRVGNGSGGDEGGVSRESKECMKMHVCGDGVKTGYGETSGNAGLALYGS